MENYRLVKENELRDLLYSYNKLMALESGGVDNWDWYCESIGDFLRNCIDEMDISEADQEDLTLDAIVNYDIQAYPIYEG